MKKALQLAMALFIISCFFLGGCATARYVPPSLGSSPEDYSCVINKSFDDTWKSLIQYAAGTFFGIENFEKDSGLITLSFGAANPSSFVDGGDWNVSSPQVRFSGKYVDYLNQYHNGKLAGKMNIVVSESEPNKTKITVNARYVFSASYFYQGRNYTNTWTFDTGGFATVNVVGRAPGTQSTRTLRPTYKAEKAILKAVESF